MSFPISTASTTFSLRKFIFFFLILLYHGATAVADDDNDNKVANIGAIIDGNSRIGKEQKTAMEIAIEDFNNSSNGNYKLVLHVRDLGPHPLQAASIVDDLIKEQGAQVIIGMETWQEAALVAEIGNRAQVPVLSLVTASITPPLTSVRWPFLARMASNESIQMRCVAAIVGSYQWRRVIVIYEDDTYGGDSGIITLLSDALKDVGSAIEKCSAFPPLSSLSNPKSTIREELEKLKNNQQSRVFIVLQSSLQLATHLFTEAKQMGMMGKDSVWITTDSITSLLDAVNSSVISSMEGIVGIKTYFSDATAPYGDFRVKFRKTLRSKYPDEDKFEPGIYALRSYDTISTIARAMERLTNNSTSKMLLENILSSNFSGLSGEIRFEEGELLHSTAYQIVNVVGKSYKELGFWSTECGFSKSVISKEDGENCTNGDSGTMQELGGPLYWPGGLLNRDPRGWVMPTDAERLKIGIPGKALFEKFVKVEEGKNPTGFCIDVFEEAVKRLEYYLPYEFMPFDGSYDELVEQVYLKVYHSVGQTLKGQVRPKDSTTLQFEGLLHQRTALSKKFDAVVGDVTILANRSKYVEFTQPYAESGLSMIVPVKQEESQKVWMFMKPFTKAMWLGTGAIFMYTMFIVWFLEHRSNPDFRGPWKNQLGTAMWFTFSTLFFAHRERIHSNFTRVVIVVWLFVVLVLNSSYTASLTSMLTVQRLEPTVTDIESLKRNNLTVGCDGDSFVRKYLENVIGLHPGSIKNITNEYDYPDEFRSGNITASFLELPYERVFLNRYCKGYKSTGQTYRFGGLGFVFPKGSPIATDFSEAFLKLSENGTITDLEKKWFKSSDECSNSSTMDNESLSLHSFWGLFILTGGTSTVVFLLYLLHLLKTFQRHHQAYGGNASPMDESLWNRTRRLVVYFNKGQLHLPEQTPTSAQVEDVDEWISSSEQYVSGYNSQGQHQTSAPSEIELPITYTGSSDTQRRLPFLGLASFPGRGRRIHAFTFDDPEREHLPSST